MAQEKPKLRTPEVLAKAEAWGVDLTQVRASAQDGVIESDDVFRAAITSRLGLPIDAPNAEIIAVAGYVHRQAEQRREAAAQAKAAREEQTRLSSASVPSTWASIAARIASKGPAFALNPRVDHIRAEAQAGRANPPTAPAPTLFASGDLPSFTASGIAPEHLLEAPWEARHAMAAAATTTEAFAILADCQQNGGSALEYADHPGNRGYAERVNQWYQDSITDEQIEAAFAQDPIFAQVIEYEARANGSE